MEIEEVTEQEELANEFSQLSVLDELINEQTKQASERESKMNHEVRSEVFDYSVLDEETTGIIKEKESVILGIHNKYAQEVGKVFYEAQQALAKKGYGCFGTWYESLGFKKRNVYNYIDIHLKVQSLHKHELEIFENQPKSMQIEMSKPSAMEEVNQAVFSGDITTHKEYKELESKLKKTAEQLQFELEKEPTVVEITPSDYDEIKKANSSFQSELEMYQKKNDELEEELNKTKSQKVDTQKYQSQIDALEKELRETREQKENLELSAEQVESMQDTIERLDSKKSRLLSIVDAANDLKRKREKLIEVFDTELATLAFKPLIDEIGSEQANLQLQSIVDVIGKWCLEMNELINHEYEVIEGEIVNDE